MRPATRRLVLDTNVYISAYGFGGKPAALIRAIINGCVGVDKKFPGPLEWEYRGNWKYHWRARGAGEWSASRLRKAIAYKHLGKKDASLELLGRALHVKQDAIGHGPRPLFGLDGKYGWLYSPLNVIHWGLIDDWSYAGSYKDAGRGASKGIPEGYVNG